MLTCPPQKNQKTLKCIHLRPEVQSEYVLNGRVYCAVGGAGWAWGGERCAW